MDAILQERDSPTNALTGFKKYYYEPSLPAAAIFTVLFGLTTAYHLARLCISRTWFMIPFMMGCTFETIGYVGRILSATQNPGPYTLGPYILQSILLLVAPALFAASIYMELGRIVARTNGDDALFVRRQWLTKIFVGGDILSFLMQASGSGLLASGNSASIDTGKTVVVAGLIVQIVFFGVFVVAGLLFHQRMRRRGSVPDHRPVPWQRHMLILYLVSILIFVRSVVRVVEFAQGYTGYIMVHEVFIYVFDAVPMLLVAVLVALKHPDELTAKSKDGELSSGAGGWFLLTKGRHGDS